MKKLLFLLVIASLLMFVSPAAWTMAQDPAPESTAQPTEEPLAAPEVTEEPEAEPTGEPTAEPTQEVVPTEEPTAEPTQEVVPTEEPTQEVVPTEEPTQEVVPTEEPTAEPTQEVVPTEEPTAEPTEEPVLTATPEVTATLTATPVPVTLSHIVIRDAAEGLGSMVYTHTMTVGEEFTVYAAGYDADGNYLWDVPVDWSLTGSLVQEASAEEESVVEEEPAAEEEAVVESPTEEVAAPEGEVAAEGDVTAEEAPVEEEAAPEATTEPAPVEEDDSRTTSFTFVPTAAGEGTIVADDGKGHAYATDVVTVLAQVKESVISHIVIRDAAEGLGSQVITATLIVSDTYIFYAAAYDAEGNYLKDVPADWTTTGTLDPVTTTQAISLTFTPLTAATSGTIVADDGAGRSDETGEIAVIAGMMASSVEAQALPGSWTTERIFVQNLSSEEATAVVTLYDSSGTETQNISLIMGGQGNGSIGSSDIAQDGKYSAVVSSNQIVAAGVHNTNYTAQAADFYVGFGTSDVDQTMYLPLVYRNHSTWISHVHVQNVHDSAQNVTLEFYAAGSSTVLHSKTVSIPSSATYTFNLGESEWTTPAGYKYGTAKVYGSAGNVAVVADHLREQSSTTAVIEMTCPGSPAWMAGTELVMPLIYAGHSSWRSGISVLNLGSTAINMTATFKSQSTGTTKTHTYTVKANSVGTFLADEIFGSGYGPLKLKSNSNDILAIASTTKYDTAGSYGFMFAGVSPNVAKSNAALPIVYKNAGAGNAWTTGVNVFNLGSSVTARLYLVRSPQCSVGPATLTLTSAVGANAGRNFYLPDASQLPTGWFGSAFASAGGNPIIAQATISGYNKGTAGIYVGVPYE